MSEQTPEEYTEFVKREYRKGGKGFQIDGNEYSVWFDETGMQIAVGHTVTDHILDKAFFHCITSCRIQYRLWCIFTLI